MFLPHIDIRLKQQSSLLSLIPLLQCEAAAASRIAAPQGHGSYNERANLQRPIYHNYDAFQ